MFYIYISFLGVEGRLLECGFAERLDLGILQERAMATAAGRSSEKCAMRATPRQSELAHVGFSIKQEQIRFHMTFVIADLISA